MNCTVCGKPVAAWRGKNYTCGQVCATKRRQYAEMNRFMAETETTHEAMMRLPGVCRHGALAQPAGSSAQGTRSLRAAHHR